MQWIMENWTTIVTVIAGAVSLASTIVGLTPTPKDDAVLKTVRDFLIRISILKPSDAQGTFKAPLTKVK